MTPVDVHGGGGVVVVGGVQGGLDPVHTRSAVMGPEKVPSGFRDVGHQAPSELPTEVQEVWMAPL